MVWLGGTDDRGGNVGLAEHPCEGDGGVGDAALASDLADTIDYFLVGIFGLGVDGFRELVGFVALGVLRLPGAGETASGKRTPRDNANAFGLAEPPPLR